VPFEFVKKDVLEMALGCSKHLLGFLHNSPNPVIDMDIVIRHDKWLAEYKELMAEYGATI
jgi:hypothetical protein